MSKLKIVMRWVSLAIVLFQIFGAILVYRDDGFNDRKAWIGFMVVIVGFGSYFFYTFRKDSR